MSTAARDYRARVYYALRTDQPHLRAVQAFTAARIIERGEEFAYDEAVCAVTHGHDPVCFESFDGTPRVRCRHCRKEFHA